MKRTPSLKVAPVQSGCQSATVGTAGFFCQYVEEVILHDPSYGTTPYDRAKLLSTGGLQIYTTLDPTDQRAANNAVNRAVISRLRTGSTAHSQANPAAAPLCLLTSPHPSR